MDIDETYSREAIQRDIANSLKYASKPLESIAFSQSALSKTMYNIMQIEYVKAEERCVVK
jgi:hypothetical protein